VFVCPKVEAEGKLIVHELLADKHKDKEVKGIRLEWAARGPSQRVSSLDMSLHFAWSFTPDRRFICVVYRTDCNAHLRYPHFVSSPANFAIRRGSNK
jgi:hypothetical protein